MNYSSLAEYQFDNLFENVLYYIIINLKGCDLAYNF